MTKIPVRKIEGEVFKYESENLDKVMSAFEVFFPKKKIKKKKVQSYLKTKIQIITAELKNKKARELAKKIISNLKKSEKKELLKEIEKHIDKRGKLFLRFDKQIAFKKQKMKLTSENESSIQIKICLTAYPAKPENYLKAALSLFSVK